MVQGFMEQRTYALGLRGRVQETCPNGIINISRSSRCRMGGMVQGFMEQRTNALGYDLRGRDQEEYCLHGPERGYINRPSRCMMDDKTRTLHFANTYLG